MKNESYFEGWGYTDRIPVTISATPRKIEILKIELGKSFPDNQIDEIDAKNIRFYAKEEQLKKLKKFVATLNGKVYYENGGKLDTKKLVYVLYEPTPRAIKMLNENGRTYLSWWQSDLTRGDSERLLEQLQIQNLILGGLRYTGDTSDLKFEQGGNIGEVLATSNPYIGGAKAIQGIAPESVSAIDRKMARKIYPDPNRPVFFSEGGKTSDFAQKKMEKVMREFKEGTLYSSSGQKVTDRKQAIAIGLSEAGLSKYIKGGQVRTLDLHDAVLYNGETWFYTEKNGVKGITNTSQGAWGSNYPFIALSKLDVENDLTDMYGKKVKFKEGGKVLASSPTKEGVSKLIEQYLYGSTITLVETEDDKIYEVHNKKGKTPFYVELKRGKYNFIQPTTFSLGGGISDSEMNEILQDLEKSYLQGTRDLKLNSDKEQIQNGRVMWENFPQERKGRLYQYLKKYDIIGEQQYIWVGDLEKINNFKAKIKELKSNGYSVIQKISAPDKKRTKSFRFIAVKPKQKFDNGGTTGSTDYSVAQTILNQLGGMKRLVIMTGAYNFVASSNAVSFRIKNRKVNYIKITLNGNDLYDLKFSRIVKYNEKVVKEYSDIYFDQLIPIFEETTGMYLRMFKKGGFINTQNRDMVIAQLKTIHHHEQEMLETLKRSGEVEAWVLSKVSNASSDLSDIAHYLEFKN